jgi:flagellar motility protein MotE (MotC chaperone)
MHVRSVIQIGLTPCLLTSSSFSPPFLANIYMGRMATLSPPPRFNSESLRGLRSTIDDLRTERETLDRFLDESLSEFEELAEELSRFDEELQKSCDALHQEQQAFLKEREQLQRAAERCKELEQQLEQQNAVLASLQRELLNEQLSKNQTQQQLASAVGDMNAAAELVDAVHNWSNELAEVARRLRERGATTASSPPDEGPGPSLKQPLPPPDGGTKEPSKGKSRGTAGETRRTAPVEAEAPSEPDRREEGTASAEMDKPRQGSSKGTNPIDPVVGSVLAQLAELERAADED